MYKDYLYLHFLCREYDDTIQKMTQTKNRLQHLQAPMVEKYKNRIKTMENTKLSLIRDIERELSAFPLWSEWGKKVKGVGPSTFGPLVFSYYCKMIPICKDCGADLEDFKCTACGKEAKGDGTLKHRLQARDFRNSAKWIKFCGMAIENGVKPKRKVGEKISWTPRLRAAFYQIGQNLVRSKDPFYLSFYTERKAKRKKTHPDASLLHQDNMAKHETAKLFAYHFWFVARALDNKPLTLPYQHTIMGHTNFIDPPYLDFSVLELAQKTVLNQDET
jgi:hypothetical protein